MTIKDTRYWLDESELKTPIHDKMVLWTFHHCFKIIKELSLLTKIKLNNWNIEEKAKVGVESKTLEYPLKSYNGFNLGYLDLLLKLNIVNGNFLPSFEHNSNESGKSFNIAFEIKPKIKSIGEVLRQFQYYKSNMSPYSILILITQTKGLKSIFESQGFYVYEYEGGVFNGPI